MRYYEDNINSNSYIEFSKNKSKANLKSEEVDNENKDSQSEDIDNIKEIINQNQIEYKGIYKIYKQDGKKQVEEIN